MLPEEAKAVQKLGRKSFHPLEMPYMPKVKRALIAELEGEPVGAFTYTIEQVKSKKVGRIDFLFTHPDYAGQGVGKQLCQAGFDFLWGEGCDLLTTYVRDDNAASWRVFERHGFVRADLSSVAGLIGWGGLITQCVKSLYAFSPAHDLYIATRDEEATKQCAKKTGIDQMFRYLYLHAFIGMLVAWRAGADAFAVASDAIAIFLGLMLAGYLGTLPSSGRKWRFRMTTGGGLLPLIFAGSIRGILFPFIGGWYPTVYEDTHTFRRDLAVNAMATWAFLLAVVAAGQFLIPLPGYINPLASFLLIFKCMPVRVVDSSGFGRVFRWNKPVACLFVALSAVVVYLF